MYRFYTSSIATSGKTTLLNILVGLDDPTKGQINVLGQALAELSEAARASLRCKHVGLLFQNAHLIPSLTAKENIEVALRLLGVPHDERSRRALNVLELVELSVRESPRPGTVWRSSAARLLSLRPGV